MAEKVRIGPIARNEVQLTKVGRNYRERSEVRGGGESGSNDCINSAGSKLGEASVSRTG